MFSPVAAKSLAFGIAALATSIASPLLPAASVFPAEPETVQCPRPVVNDDGARRYVGYAACGQKIATINWQRDPNDQWARDIVVVGTDYQIYDGKIVFSSAQPWKVLNNGRANPAGGGIFWHGEVYGTNGWRKGHLRVYGVPVGGTPAKFYCLDMRKQLSAGVVTRSWYVC